MGLSGWGEGRMWTWKQLYESPIRVVSTGVWDTDKQLFDMWSLAHMMMGALQFVFIPPVWLGVGGSIAMWYTLNLVLHVLFEWVENSPLIVVGLFQNRLGWRSTGDTLLNSVGDLLSFSVGYLCSALAWRSAPESALAYGVVVCFVVLGLVPFVRRYVRRNDSRV